MSAARVGATWELRSDGVHTQNTSAGEEGAAGGGDNMFEAGQGAVGVRVGIGMQRARQGGPCEVWEVSGAPGGPVQWDKGPSCVVI